MHKWRKKDLIDINAEQRSRLIENHLHSAHYDMSNKISRTCITLFGLVVSNGDDLKLFYQNTFQVCVEYHSDTMIFKKNASYFLKAVLWDSMFEAPTEKLLLIDFSVQ